MDNIILVKGITCILTHFLLCLTFKLRKRSKILIWDKLAGSKCFLCISYLVSLRWDYFCTQWWQSRELIPLTFPFSFSFSRAGGCPGYCFFSLPPTMWFQFPPRSNVMGIPFCLVCIFQSGLIKFIQKCAIAQKTRPYTWKV